MKDLSILKLSLNGNLNKHLLEYDTNEIQIPSEKLLTHFDNKPKMEHKNHDITYQILFKRKRNLFDQHKYKFISTHFWIPIFDKIINVRLLCFFG